ncbi:MAG: efflux transporter outer membrane subunit [Gammaproteobacteria bacterium]|nr:efflux transporter outer membrane subunit [Gammaproteobacteria bacterium]MCP5426128.1 efflux transporter outer membrane subunit [Gammaproteobacteria bacterium]
MRVRRERPALTALTVALMLTGCAAVGPNYVAPETEAPTAWQGATAAKVTIAPAAPADLARWWQTLDDPTLSRLIDQALRDSLDLRTAEAKLRQARAQRALAGAQLFPTVSGSAGGQRVKASGESGGGGTGNLFNAGFDASWEPDVFGGLRRGEEAAQADLEASEASLHDVQVSLSAEVALNYVELRNYQTRLEIARANAASQQETLQLTEWRAQAGLTTELDVAQARSNLEQTRAQLPTLDTGRAEAEHRLETLLGLQPGALQASLASPGGVPEIPERIIVIIPADTLRQRPDVSAAERGLAAETARIGEVQAEAYPSFPLKGSIGLAALTLGNLVSADAGLGSLAGSIAGPIFDAGRIRQQVAIQTAVQEQALINYQATVLNALEEVENALVSLANARQRRENLQNATQAAQVAAQLARFRYSSGIIDFQTVLDTERTVLTLEDSLISSQAEGVSALIQLYKALGGGWSPTAVDQANVSAQGNTT